MPKDGCWTLEEVGELVPCAHCGLPTFDRKGLVLHDPEDACQLFRLPQTPEGVQLTIANRRWKVRVPTDVAWLHGTPVDAHPLDNAQQVELTICEKCRYDVYGDW